MGYSGQARHIPTKHGIIHCSSCGLIIEEGDGRRFRMKYRHFHCLPDGRLDKIRGGWAEAARTREKYREASDATKEE